MQRFILTALLVVLAHAHIPSAKAADSPSFQRTSRYVAARDGTRLAVDVVLPEHLPAGRRLPTVLIQTRYWRNFELAVPDGVDTRPMEKFYLWKASLIERGYAVVVMDVRGSGASFGVHTQPFSEAEIRDGHHLVEWIVQQPWSNGRVAGLGDSYEGTTAMQLLVDAHPAVKAVAARYFEWDVFTDASHPGGIPNAGFIAAWHGANVGLDANVVPCEDLSEEECAALRKVVRGVLPASTNRADLRTAVAQHRRNLDVLALMHEVRSRDQTSSSGVSIDAMSLRSRLERIASHVPILWATAWFDSGTTQGALRAYRLLQNPIRMQVAGVNHGGSMSADPFLPLGSAPVPDEDQQRMSVIDFLDRHLAADEAPAPSAIEYYVNGSGQWRKASYWPPRGTTMHKLYFAAQGRLDPRATTASSGADRYVGRADTSSGDFGRWYSLMGGPLHHGDRSAQDDILLTYTSDPLSQTATLVGNPVLHLRVATDQPDAKVFAYLESVAPDGRSTYLTEGLLNLAHRKLDVLASLEAGTWKPSFMQRDRRSGTRQSL